MGIVLAVFYAIAYAIAIAVSLFIKAKFAPEIDSSLERRRDHNAGFAIAIVTTLAIAWFVPSHGNADVEAVVTKLEVTLLLPLLLGSLLLAISHSLIDNLAYRLGRIASGVLHSVLAGYNWVANFPMG
jgi:hypothetical protein